MQKFIIKIKNIKKYLEISFLTFMFSYADKFTTGQDNCAQLSGVKRN